jgi:tetratricopeptide (TPR) repeat protein
LLHPEFLIDNAPGKEDMSQKRDALIDEARTRLARGDYAGGARSLSKLLRQRPADAEGLYLLGVLQLQDGKAAEAADLMRRALGSGLVVDPAILENIGTAYLMSGSPAAAVSLLRKAVAAGGNRSVLHMRLGMALAGLGQLEEAESMLRLALQQNPLDHEVSINLGNVLASRGQVDAALEQYQQVLRVVPGHVRALYNMGTLHRAAFHTEEAIKAYEQVLSIAPDHVEALINLGTLREHLGDPEDAERLYRKVLAIDPENAIACSNLSTALRAQTRLDEAERCCRQALALAPDFADALVNLGGIQAAKGQLESARETYYQAWKINPDDAEVQLWYGTLGLATGNFSDSWLHYRARASRRDVIDRVVKVDEHLPEDISGRRVLLVGEQGIGDELFFLRYAAQLKAKRATLLCICDKKIIKLLERTALFDELYTHEDKVPERDLTFAAGDLPLVCHQPASSNPVFPAPLALQPLPDCIEAMRAYLSRLGPPPYLALTWRAGTRLKDQQTWRDQFLSKEVPLDMLGKCVEGYKGSVLSVQRHPEAGETERLAGMLGVPVHDASGLNSDLEMMLALMGLVTEYVGVSNTNMHLRAALGGLARLLVPNPAEWRWMAQGRTSPWFPHFSVYRQSTDLSWDDAVVQLQGDLAAGAADDAEIPGGSLS